MASTPNWLSLPKELTLLILSRLEAIDILKAVQWVCMMWYNVCKDPSMWKSIKFGDDIKIDGLSFISRMGRICKNAVDRSCGQLNHISIHHFATDKLLLYIARRAPNLRTLRLVSCCLVYEKGLKKVAKRLPNLEELHMILVEVSKEVLLSFGNCCPQLKSLTYDTQSVQVDPSEEDIIDENAQAIAQTMPRLCHLSLVGNRLTNDGLQAILNQCPRLESLDLRGCRNVNLEGPFGRPCAKWIKNLKCPIDSTEDYKYFDPSVFVEMDDYDVEILLYGEP